MVRFFLTLPNISFPDFWQNSLTFPVSCEIRRHFLHVFQQSGQWSPVEKVEPGCYRTVYLVGTVLLLRGNVYILVYPVKQPQQELLRVMLHAAAILRAVTRHRRPELAGDLRRHAMSPQRLDNGREALGELAASARPHAAAAASRPS